MKTNLLTRLIRNDTQIRIIILADWAYIKKVKVGVYDPLDKAIQSMIDLNYTIDAIFVNGDIGYDLDSLEGVVYEEFIKNIEPGGITLASHHGQWKLRTFIY